MDWRLHSALAACLLAGGCAVSGQTGSKDMLFDRDGIDIVTTTAARQMVMIKDPASAERYCRGPEPDASVATSGGVSLSMPVGTGAKLLGEQSRQESSALGGRNPAVLITRELLYRACELSMNLDADAERTLAIYREFMEVAARIAITQTQAGTPASPDPRAAPKDADKGDDDDKGGGQDGDKDANSNKTVDTTTGEGKSK